MYHWHASNDTVAIFPEEVVHAVIALGHALKGDAVVVGFRAIGGVEAEFVCAVVPLGVLDFR